jgi:hypothetical protein
VQNFQGRKYQSNVGDYAGRKKLVATNSSITVGIGKDSQISIRDQAREYLKKNADEFRKNSHLQHWAPPEIFLLRGTSLNQALKHLDVNNLRKMNNSKKEIYKEKSGCSKPSIVKHRLTADFNDLRLDGRQLTANKKQSHKYEMDMMIQAYMQQNIMLQQQEEARLRQFQSESSIGQQTFQGEEFRVRGVEGNGSQNFDQYEDAHLDNRDVRVRGEINVDAEKMVTLDGEGSHSSELVDYVV